jgi:hypothetical protein
MPIFWSYCTAIASRSWRSYASIRIPEFRHNGHRTAHCKSTMPVTFSPSSVDLTPYARPEAGKSTAGDILRDASPANARKATEILQSTFSLKAEPDPAATLSSPSLVVPRTNGLVDTVVDAYNHHHALVLRPDDVWLCILSQFNFFLNGQGRAEALRAKFVAHEGKKELRITVNGGTRYDVDFGALATQMTDLIQQNVVDPELRAWIMPSFSTTTANDVVVGAVTMMATLREFFTYTFCCITCGIPLVRLDGEQADWEDILARIDKLKEYGPETTAWARLLEPVLSRFVSAFGEPGYATSAENRDFWQRIAHVENGGSGPSYLSGWITTFCVFNDKGEWIGGPLVSVFFLHDP